MDYANKPCPKCNQHKVVVSHYSEDFATVTEVRCDGCKSKLDRNYIGATNWEVAHDRASKNFESFAEKWS